MEDCITRAEHEAFAKLMNSENKRLEEENDRQNKRLAILEENTRQITNLAVSVRELAINMQNMTTELSKQNDSMEQQAKRTGERLEKLENRDGEKWRQVASYLLTLLIGAAVGLILKQIGM